MIQQNKLIRILSPAEVDKKDISITTELFWNQTAKVRKDGTESDSVAIKRRV